jgi:hypothetical protein
VILASALMIGCINVTGGGNTVTGSGPAVTEDRTVGSFDKLEVQDGTKVVLSIGPTVSVRVSAQQNILPLISTTVADGKLTVQTTGSMISTVRPEVTVVTPSLTALTLRDGASVDATGIAASTFVIDAGDGAHANLSGTVQTLTLNASDGVLLQLGGLAATDVTMTTSNGVTGTINASGTVSGSASNGVLLNVSGGATVNGTTSGGAFVTSQ